MTPTPLDRAFAAGEESEAARRRAYALLLETSLCTPLLEQAEGSSVEAPPRPMVFEISDGPMALGFDDDGRMAAFFDAPTIYAALPGRALIGLLAEAGLGLAVNPDAPAAVLDPEAVRWIAREMLAPPETVALSGALRVAPPSGAPPSLLAACAERLAAAPGFVSEAWLARLGPEGAPGALTLAFAPNPAARRAADGLAAMLARCAEPHAPEGEPVAVGAFVAEAPLAVALRAQGVRLFPLVEAPPSAPRTPRSDAPPTLR